MGNFSDEKIEQLVKEYSPGLLRFALAYLRNHSESQDVVQEVFIKFIRKQPVFISEAQEKSWLYKVTSNKCKDILKSSRYKKEMPITQDIDELEMPKETEILNFVLNLEEKYRIPVHLYYYEGYSIKEIAKLTSINPSTISTHLDRARKILKDVIGEAI